MSYSPDEIKKILNIQEKYQEIFRNPRTGIKDNDSKSNFLYRNEHHDLKAGLFKIGAFYTYVPPSKISITQRLQNDQVILLRAPGSMKKMGKTVDITINLEVLFPNLAAINENLRPIIAQFIRTPFVPIENVHVQDILIPDVRWTKTENDKNNVTQRVPGNFEIFPQEVEDYIRYEANRSKIAWVNSLDDIKKRIEDFNKELEKNNNDSSKIAYYEEQIAILQKQKQELEDKILKYNTTDFETYIYNNVRSFKNSDEYKEEYEQNRMYVDRSIPVALESIHVSTIPGYSDLIQANISLKVFNNAPYNPTFEFVQDKTTAFRQVEFFGHLGNYQYPIEALKRRGIPLYDQSSIHFKKMNYTKNLSESEPFIAYISPLLTGQPYTMKVDNLTMIDKFTLEKTDEMYRSLTFNAPVNYLRKAEIKDFNKINASFIVSDKERSLYRKLSQEISNIMSIRVNNLLKDITPTPNTIKGNLNLFWNVLIVDTFSLRQIRESTELAIQTALNEINPDNLMNSNVTIPDSVYLTRKTSSGKEKKLELTKGDQMLMKDFKNKIVDFMTDDNNDRYNLLLNEAGDIVQKLLTSQYFAQNGKLERYLFRINTSGDDVRKTVITGMTAGMINMLAPIPMEGMQIPTYQHMGRSDWNIELNIQTCDTHLIRTFMDINDKLYTNNSNKNVDPYNLFLHEMNSIHLDPEKGNGFFKILGVNNVVINGIRFNNVETKPGWFNFAIHLQQNDIDPIKYEELTYMNSINENVIQTITNLFMKHYTWKHPEGHYSKLLEMYPIYANIYVPQMRRYGFQRFFNIFYGDYNKDIVESMYFTESKENNINKIIIDYPKLITGNNKNTTTYLTGAYGQRTNGFHYGVDLSVRNNQPNIQSTEEYLQNTYILAPLTGKVVCDTPQVKNGELFGYGNRVILEHDLFGQKVYTLYAHLKEVLVKNGDIIQQGSKIGVMGNTGSAVSGNSQGEMKPHLHYEIFLLKNKDLSPINRSNRIHVNPMNGEYEKDNKNKIDYVVSKYEYSDKERIIGDKEIEIYFTGKAEKDQLVTSYEDSKPYKTSSYELYPESIQKRYEYFANKIFKKVLENTKVSTYTYIVNQDILAYVHRRRKNVKLDYGNYLEDNLIDLMKSETPFDFFHDYQFKFNNYITSTTRDTNYFNMNFKFNFPEINKSNIFSSMYSVYKNELTSLFDIVTLNSNRTQAIYDIFIRSLVVSYINAYPQEATNMYNDYMKEIGEKELDQTDILPAWYAQTRAEHEYLSNYNDLDLPINPSQKSFTPADFYFRKNYEMTDFANIENDIISNTDNIRFDWMLQFKDSIYFLLGEVRDKLTEFTNENGQLIIPEINYKEFQELLIKLQEEFEKTGTILASGSDFKNDISGLLKKLEDGKDQNLDKVMSEIKFNDSFNQIITYIHDKYMNFLISRPNNSQSYLFFLKNYNKISKIFQNVSANVPLFTIKNLAIIKNLLTITTLTYGFQESLKSGNEFFGQNGALVGDQKQVEMINSDTQYKIASAINDMNAVLGAPNTSLLGIVTPYSLLTTQDIIARTKIDYEFIKGNNTLNNMERAFPTCLLYFIEEDSKSWKKLDDFYNYNGIVSCKVVKSKDSASDLCELVISNITGNLTDPNSVQTNENQTKDQSRTQEQTVKSMFISEGTTIMVKMGYNANPELLPRVFMGKIVSIEYGEQIMITAQSFGAELLEYINNGMKAKYGYTSACRTHGDIVITALQTMDNMLHFGSKSIFEMLGFTNIYRDLDNITSIKENGIWESWFWNKYTGYKLLKNWVLKQDIYLNFNIYDPRMENIYLPVSNLNSNDAIRSTLAIMDYGTTSPLLCFTPNLTITNFIVKTILGNIFSQNKNVNEANVNDSSIFNIKRYLFPKTKKTQKILFNGTFDWVIQDNTTLWDLLQEIKLYHEDYIVTVLPYNDFLMGTTRDTVYIGPRNGFYKYTDIFDTNEKFIEQRKRVESKEKLFKQVYGTDDTRQEVINQLDEYADYLEDSDLLDKQLFKKFEYELEKDQKITNPEDKNWQIKKGPFNQIISGIQYKVIDGDSIWDYNNKKEYRYLGTDTYETVVGPNDNVVLKEQYHLGVIGKKINYILLKLGEPQFVTDGDYDQYDRPLVRAYVKYDPSKNTDFVNELERIYKETYKVDLNLKNKIILPYNSADKKMQEQKFVPGTLIDIASVINAAGLNRTYRDFNSKLFYSTQISRLVKILDEIKTDTNDKESISLFDKETVLDNSIRHMESETVERVSINSENIDENTLKEINVYLGNLKEILLEDMQNDFMDRYDYTYNDLIEKLKATLNKGNRWTQTKFDTDDIGEFIVNKFNNEKDVYLYEDYLGNIKGIDPSYKPVVNYYIIDSANNIIQNNIRASSEEIYNKLILKYPLDPTNSADPSLYYSTFTVDDHIDPACINTFTSVQRNIDRMSFMLLPNSFTYFWEARKAFNKKSRVFPQYPNYLTVGYNLLAECMRPMYRGELTIIGNPTIKPYDSVILSDAYKDMKGPIEVDSVVHEYSPNGLITTITPCAVVKTNNIGASFEYLYRTKMKIPFMYIFTATFSGQLTAADKTMYYGGNTLFGLGTATTLGKMIASGSLLIGGWWWAAPIAATIGFGAAWFATSFYMKHFDAFMCRNCINLIGLWYKGLPMSAGMEGAYRDSYEAFKQDELYNLLDENVLMPATSLINP